MASGVSAARCVCSFCVVPVMRRQCLRPRNRRLSHSDATSRIESIRRGCVFFYYYFILLSAYLQITYPQIKGGSGRVVKRAAILPSRACVFCVRVAVIFFKRVLCVCMMCTYMCFCSPPDKAGLSPLNFCTSGGGRPLSTLCRKYSKTAGAQCSSVVFLHNVKCTPKKYG